MFAIDQATADAIRQAYEKSGELAAIVELRSYFPLFENNEHARSCVRSIVSWKLIPFENLPMPPRAPRTVPK